MTKFQRAKKQTLRKLEPFVMSDVWNQSSKTENCGFCPVYKYLSATAWCKGCPITLAEGGRCCNETKWWGDWIESKGEAQFLFALALYGWIESLHE